MFQIGQRVICVKNPIARINDMGLPGYRKGRIYTVASLYEEEPYGMFITSRELSPYAGGHVSGFRPIIERKTDISIFTSMLTPNKRRVKERA